MFSLTRFQRAALIATRFITALCLSLWIGGMAFFGIMAAPVLFHPEKSGIARAANTATLAPQIVSAMLTRFGTLTTVLSALIVVSVLIDGFLSRATKNHLWRGQTLLAMLCLGLSFYLNTVLLPQTRRDQAEILPLIARAARGETLTPQEKTRRLAFDNGHSGYQRLATINIYLLLALLFILIARGAAIPNSDVPKRAAKL
nr:DUF4149 domain-containing protein [Abditibacterium utsteinense]